MRTTRLADNYFPRSIQSGYVFWDRLINEIYKEMYTKFNNTLDGANGKRIDKWIEDKAPYRKEHIIFEWVPMANSYHLKLNREGVQYMDIFPRTEKEKDGKDVTYTLQELTLNSLQDNYVDIEYGLAKTFNLIYETEKDGKTFTHLTGSVKIEHFREPTVKTGENDQISKIWDIVENDPLSRTLPYGCKGEVTKYVRFYSYVNWY